MTKIIGIIQLKGGAGRSTVATNLATALARKSPTALIDCDMPQGTSASWYALREEDGKTDGLSLDTIKNHRQLVDRTHHLAEHHEYLVIDGPPRIAEVTRAILMVCDLILIPLATSVPEIWATTDLLDTIEEAKEHHPNLQVRIVWNRFRSYTLAAKELPQEVKRELKIPALKTWLGYRVAYSEALARGMSADEWSDKKAKSEVLALSDEVWRLLRRM